MSDTNSLQARALDLALKAKAASRIVSAVSSGTRTQALLRLVGELESKAFAEELKAANDADVADARANGQTAALVDRLVLDAPRLTSLTKSVRDIAWQDDPIGEVVAEGAGPSGIKIKRVRAPLGTILMIYEARPNVTVDAAALCLRSGNAVLLRGGSEARRSNEVLVNALRRSLVHVGLPEDCVQLVPADRALLEPLLALEEHIDLCIPRGGQSLIRFIAEKSRIPVIKHYQGVCHLYVAGDADLPLAEKLLLNGKAQRPGVCNAVECVLVDASIANDAISGFAQSLSAAGVELRCDPRALPLAIEGVAHASEIPDDVLRAAGTKRAEKPGQAIAAVEADYGTEFLDYKLLVCVVDGIDAALTHIAKFGSKHTESICTKNDALADRFTREVDASCTLVNASSRFNDGAELGLGAEIGISTSKLHAYGPMGARELTCTRFVVRGAGQVRT
ncbi:MAG: glutamate-5-semialdehyde dehydrogenase [Deltaproteobacteria bacterium]|nr:glutamate-5-semialdehyde dehydrogenase [Deltaproteobacteria bacterium]